MEGDLTLEKTPSGYKIAREGRYGSATFFLLKNKEEFDYMRDLMNQVEFSEAE